MKILLINPKNVDSYPWYVPYQPLGLLYIASYAREKGFKDIKIIDCAANPPSKEELEKDILHSDIVGVGGFTPQFKHAIEISKICRQLNKLSVCGGVQVSAMPANALEMSEFDIAVKGEGEVTFCELLKNYSLGNLDFSAVDGLAYRQNGKVIESKNRVYIDDLNMLPFPARDLLPMERYKIGDEYFSSHYTIIQSTRGCPHECTFCNSPRMWSRKLRARSAESLVSEISELYHKYGFKCIHISDDGFTYRRQIVVDTCNLLIAKGLNIEWACVSRPELVDSDLLRLMKKSGCIRISIGVESADLGILNRAKKKYDLNKIEESVKLIKEAGILVHCYMMIGLPGENIRTYCKSVKFMRKLKPDRIGWAVVVPYPGTELYDKRMVEIVDNNYLEWAGYWNPVIKIGILSPFAVKILRLLADFLTSKKYQGRNVFISCFLFLTVYLPLSFFKSIFLKVKKLWDRKIFYGKMRK